MSWIASSVTQFPRGTVSLGVVLRSVAIASWTDNLLKADSVSRHYTSVLGTRDDIRVFCENTVKTARTCVPCEPTTVLPGHFQVTVAVRETGETLTAQVPSDAIAMYGSKELAAFMTAGIIHTSSKNQHVQDGEAVTIADD